jgi:hypothetical protein
MCNSLTQPFIDISISSVSFIPYHARTQHAPKFRFSVTRRNVIALHSRALELRRAASGTGPSVLDIYRDVW